MRERETDRDRDDSYTTRGRKKIRDRKAGTVIRMNRAEVNLS
jgi:hypothetical protein